MCSLELVAHTNILEQWNLKSAYVHCCLEEIAESHNQGKAFLHEPNLRELAEIERVSPVYPIQHHPST